MLASFIISLAFCNTSLQAQSSPPEPGPELGSGEANTAIAPVPEAEAGSLIAPRVSKSELEGQGFGWRNAFVESGLFLSVMHGFRMATEPGSRHEMVGPFFRDWFRSVKGVRGWGDGDPFIVNYIGHPMQGAVFSYIQVQNDPHGRTQEFGADPDYWKSRLRGMAWAAVNSAQFEVGPMSEASLGNVGMKAAYGAGFVDLVTTPIAGMGWTVMEDAIDRYLINWVERKTSNRWIKLTARSTLNPMRAMANLMARREPWRRTTRPGLFEDWRTP